MPELPPPEGGVLLASKIGGTPQPKSDPMDNDNPNTSQPSTSGIVWRLPIVGWASLFVIAGVSVLVFAISKRSLYDELEYTIAIVAFIIFIFLSDGLYTAARLQGKPFAPKFDALKVGFAAFKMMDILDLFVVLGEIAIWIGVTILALVLLFFFATVLWSAILVLACMLYWLLYRAIRIVLLKGPRCQGNLKLSFLYAAWYSFLYCGWIFGVVWLAEHRPWQ